MRNKIIGLTGNTGSGKSSVAKILQNNRALVIDADSIAHEIIMPEQPAYFELLGYFGNILSPEGFIDRKKLAATAFANEEKKQKLTEITHKYIVKEMLERLDKAIPDRINYSGVILDAPLLIEANLHLHVDEVWLVYADEQVRLKRIMQRDGISKEQAILRIKAQTTFEELKKHAHVLIENNNGLDDLKEKIKELLKGF